MSKKRILIIENSTHITGALKSICRSSFDLGAHFDFVFVLPKGSKGKAWVQSRGFNTIYELPMRELRKSIIALIVYLPMLVMNAIRLRQIIKKEKIDLVHNNDLYNMLPVMATGLGKCVPYINHVRFLPGKFPAKLFLGWLKLHLRYGQRVVCVSEFLRNQLPSHPKIRMIYNELPLDENYPPTLETTHRLLYLSNIIQGKGQDFVIEAFSKIAHQHPDWKLRFVGGDMGLKKNRQFKDKLMAMCQQKGITQQVEWHNFTNDVEREYKTAGITLNFSESESFSLTCLEAQFFGCPVVATRSGGPAEIINDGQNGFLVPLGDIHAMANAMDVLMKDEQKRKEFIVAGRKMVREKFSLQNTSYRLKELYNEVLL
jgi:L-malate glycosyltransferase